jgi:glycosyltransferase involved in cell wall biosynthesis
MAAGRPVVLAIDGVIRDLIEGAGAGIYVPPGDHEALADAVCNLADNPDLRAQLGSNGRACVESQYHRATLTARMAEIMTGLIEK